MLDSELFGNFSCECIQTVEGLRNQNIYELHDAPLSNGQEQGNNERRQLSCQFFKKTMPGRLLWLLHTASTTEDHAASVCQGLSNPVTAATRCLIWETKVKSVRDYR
jgi:hypothetical protein